MSSKPRPYAWSGASETSSSQKYLRIGVITREHHGPAIAALGSQGVVVVVGYGPAITGLVAGEVWWVGYHHIHPVAGYLLHYLDTVKLDDLVDERVNVPGSQVGNVLWFVGSTFDVATADG